MKMIINALLLSAALFATVAIAGPGHEHKHGHHHEPVSADVAKEKAKQKVIQLVKDGKIDSSWSTINAAGAEQKSYGNGPEWVVTFNNSAISDDSKQTLYLFFSLNGHYIAANYTGQ